MQTETRSEGNRWSQRIRSWVALLLSLLAPGWGHIHLGWIRRGLAAYAVGAGLVVAGCFFSFRTRSGLVLTAVASVLWYLAVAWDARRRAKVRVSAPAPWYVRWSLIAGLFFLDGVIAGLFLDEDGLASGQRRLAGRYQFGISVLESMQPFLNPGDRFVLDIACYRSASPQRQDVIAFEAPPEAGETGQRVWVKRCMAIAGDLVEVRDGTFYLNGEAEEHWEVPNAMGGLPPEYLIPLKRYGPLRVPSGTVFCMGDNRGNSVDSRFWGPLPLAAVRGKVIYVFWRG